MYLYWYEKHIEISFLNLNMNEGANQSTRCGWREAMALARTVNWRDFLDP